MAVQVYVVFTECQSKCSALENRVTETNFFNILDVLGECNVFLQYHKLSVHQYWVWS